LSAAIETQTLVDTIRTVNVQFAVKHKDKDEAFFTPSWKPFDYGQGGNFVTARIAAEPRSGGAPLTVNFDGSKSSGEDLSYAWDFGDGQSGSGATVEHTFTEPGTYTTTLTVDNGEKSDDGTITITVYQEGENLLSGTVIGTEGSWNNAGNTRDKVFDENTGTFFDAAEANGAWVGLDLGADNAARITRIRFHPRSGYEDRMNGGVFEGSSSSDFSDPVGLATVSTSPSGGWTELVVTGSEALRYVRYRAPDGGHGNVAEIEFYGTVGGVTGAWRPHPVQARYGSGTNAVVYYTLRGQKQPVSLTRAGSRPRIAVFRDGATRVQVSPDARYTGKSE
jgi:PKD repeat protein